MEERISTITGKTYKDLKVFQLSYSLGLMIHKKSLEFPAVEQYGLARQVRNSASSVPVNIAEGMAKQASATETIRFLKIAVGSCEETKVWLNYALDLGYISFEEYNELNSGYIEVGKMLNGLIKHWLLKT